MKFHTQTVKIVPSSEFAKARSTTVSQDCRRRQLENFRGFGNKTANINSKKRQSLLNSVVIGHRHSKTAKIMKGRRYSERWVMWNMLS
jgi:hypothetical protein